MKSPLFSVLMANYNRGQFIAEAIESVLAQSYANLELIIVDDGSTDTSISIIKSYAEKDSRIHYVASPINKGCGATMKHCADIARGEFFGYIGSDDVLLSNAVEEIVKAHRQSPECSLVYSSHFVCDEKLNRIQSAYGAGHVPSGESYLTYGKGVTSFASITKKYYDLTSGVDPSFKRAVDQDLYYKLEEVGSLRFVPDELYLYRVNSSGISTRKNISKARYWFGLAKENAYHRRLKSNTVKNIRKKDLRAWWSVVFVSKASDAFNGFRICGGFYWLGRSLTASLFDQYFILKVKSLFLNSYIHQLILSKRNKK